MGGMLKTPNGQRGGITLWCGPLMFCMAWSRDVGRGFDFYWNDTELFRMDW